MLIPMVDPMILISKEHAGKVGAVSVVVEVVQDVVATVGKVNPE